MLDEQPRRKLVLHDNRRHEGYVIAFARENAQHRHIIDLRNDNGTDPGVAIAPVAVQGHMTSVCFSPTLGHWIGLGLLTRGAARLGERLRAYDPVRGEDFVVEVVSPVFVDPEGKRLHV